MSTATLRNLGGSIVVSVPKKVLELVGLEAGSRVDVQVQRGMLILKPRKRRKYTLDELLAKTRRSDMAPSKADRDWLQSPPRGREVL